jgi:gamma-glutamylputrescine oxidase
VAKAAADLGAKVFEGSPAIALDLAGAEKRITTPGGRVTAKNVVFAMGGYQDKLHNRLHGKLRRAVLPIATYVMVTEPLGGNRLKEAIRVPYAIGDTKFATDYYRPLDDTRILWGGRISARLREPGDLKAKMLGDLTKIYPQLAGIDGDVAWMGTMSYAGHKMPQIGTLEPGIWYAQAFGGSGMSTTSMAGLLLAEGITGQSDRYRHFKCFGIPWAGGDLGRLTAQMVYWGLQMGDAWRVVRKN